jgi:hypothetical protein
MKNLSKVTLLAVVVAMSSVIATPAAVADTKPAADVEKLSSDKLHEERAYTLGTSAFIWGFPMTELYRVRDKSVSQGHKVNTFNHDRKLFTAEQAIELGVVRANSATLYSFSWLDLSIEPIVVDIPPIQDRYFTINYVDFYQKNENISNATTGRKGGAYAFVGPNWRGPLPDGLHRLDVATDTVWIIGRTEVKGQDDVKNVHAIQDKYQLTSLSEWSKGKRNTTGDNQYEAWPPYDVSDPVNWFALLNEGLRRNPPQGADLVMLGLLEPLDIGPDMHFDPKKLDKSMAAGLKRAVTVGPQLLKQYFGTHFGVKANHWEVSMDLATWVTPVSGQTDFLLRGAIAKGAQPGQSLTQAQYALAGVDSEGNPFNGSNKYTLRFEKGQMPPVDAFWALTLYDAKGFPVPKVIRNQIGTYDALKKDKDGSVTLYIQNASPGKNKESNWLPAPKGAFNLAMRLYNPKTEARTLDWVTPGVKKVQ